MNGYSNDEVSTGSGVGVLFTISSLPHEDTEIIKADDNTIMKDWMK